MSLGAVRCRLVVAMLLATCCTMSGAGEAGPGASPARRFLYIESQIAGNMVDLPDRKKDKAGDDDDTTLVLRGTIDEAMRARFDEAMARGDIARIRITSHGGQSVLALQMATLIQARGIEVVVRDLCLGACAQYIFIAGSKRRLEKGSLVGFGVSIKGSALVHQMAFEQLAVPSPLGSAFPQFVAAEESFYRQAGVSESFLTDMDVAVQPRCVVIRRDGDRARWSTTRTYAMWIPARKYLDSVGVRFEGDWPSSRLRTTWVAAGVLKGGVLSLLRYADDDHRRDKKQKPYALEQVKQCVLDEEAADPAQ